MGSVYEEISRLETAKSDIETAIETCGVNVPDTELIDTYASYIRQIPSAVFSELNVDPVGGSDQFIQSIKQTNGLIEATVGGLVSTSNSGLVPKADGSAGVINNQTDDYVLTYKGGTIDWYKLPANAFKNDDNNTTYTLSGALNGNAYDVTLTPSSGSATGAKVPAMGAASSNAAGTAGLVPAPAKNKHNSFLRGDGTWAVPDNTTYSVMTGATASAAGTSGLVPQPAKGDQGKFLSGAGTWTALPGLSVTDSESGNAVTDVEVSGHGITLKRGTTFSVNGHKHSSDDITALTSYVKATAASAIASTDSLNTALGKLELKADTAYTLTAGAYDGDGTIENLAEILKVLEGISDTDTIQAIVGKYLPLAGGMMTGNITFDTNRMLRWHQSDSYSISCPTGGDGAYLLLKAHNGTTIAKRLSIYKTATSLPNTAYNLYTDGSLYAASATIGGPVKITGGSDLTLQASSGAQGDAGDVVFMDYSGAELGRIWLDSTASQALSLRYGANDATKRILHSGNSSVSKSGETLTVKINGVEQSITNSTYTTLPNPYNISFKDASNNTVTYNGSSALDLTGGIYYAVTARDALRFKGLASSGDLNTVLAGGGMARTYSNYLTGDFTNAPSGAYYGTVLQLSTAGFVGLDTLSGQLAWDINHNSTTDATRYLWWRAADTNGFTNSKWHQIAFTDSNVASATTSSYIAYTVRQGKGSGVAQFAQYNGATDNPTDDWYSHIIMNHANSAGYFTEIAACFHSDSVYFRRQVGTTTAWKRFALSGESQPASDVYAWAKKSSLDLTDVPDLSSKYLPLSGGILSKNSASILVINNTNNTTSSGSQYSGVRFSWNGTVVSGIHGRNGSETLWRSNASFTNAFEIFDTGNYTSWVPKLDGTGASGTWAIDISGKASTVTIGTSTANAYRAIVVTNGSNGLYTAGAGSGKPQYNYSTGDVKAYSFTTDGGNFNGNVTGTAGSTAVWASSAVSTNLDTVENRHGWANSSGSATNLPTSVSAGTLVSFSNSSSKLQFFGGYKTTHGLHYRKWYSSSWESWRTILDSNNWSSFITIPSVGNGTVTINQAGASKGSFTLNQSTDATINLTDTNYYPTAFSWTGGTTAGPTGSLTGVGMSSVSFGAIPSASGSASGIVTTAAQTFAGEKTFSAIRLRGTGGANYGGYLYFGDGSYAYIAELSDDELYYHASGGHYFEGLNHNFAPVLVGTIYRKPGDTSYSITSNYIGIDSSSGSTKNIGISVTKSRAGKYAVTLTNNTSTTVRIHAPVITSSHGDWGGGSCYESPFAYLDYNSTCVFPKSLSAGSTLSFNIICGRIHTQGSWNTGDFTKSDDNSGFICSIYASYSGNTATG